ncbi:uncharacterized protein LOC135593264 isoform X1 [Musa acuminata AAA Group]
MESFLMAGLLLSQLQKLNLLLNRERWTGIQLQWWHSVTNQFHLVSHNLILVTSEKLQNTGPLDQTGMLMQLIGLLSGVVSSRANLRERWTGIQLQWWHSVTNQFHLVSHNLILVTSEKLQNTGPLDQTGMLMQLIGLLSGVVSSRANLRERWTGIQLQWWHSVTNQFHLVSHNLILVTSEKLQNTGPLDQTGMLMQLIGLLSGVVSSRANLR